MFILDLPLWAALVIILVMSIILSYLGLKFIHKFYKYEQLSEIHQLSSYIFNAYGLLYAVLIAFVIYINWSEFDEAQRQVYVETNQLSNIFHNAQGFNDTLKTKVLKATAEYTETIMTDDFQAMKKLRRGIKTRDSYDKLWESIISADLSTIKNQKAYEICLSELNQVSEARRLRYLYMENTIPAVIWVIIIIGCVITLAFSYSFGIKRRYPYILFVISFTYVNVLMLYLILVLDYPFSGYNSISIEPYAVILNHFKEVLSAIK
ncbi:MAG: DUF4239 domain-containing protein [Bacteroidetes bacterium]|nr:DUF4239 domain-containing protein [Bacteroidota bacterium]